MGSNNMNERRNIGNKRIVIAASAVALLFAVTTQKRAFAANPSPADGSNSIDLALTFEPNLGQGESGVQFVARGPGYTLYLNEEGSSFHFSSPVRPSTDTKRPPLSMKLVGQKKSDSALQGFDERPSRSSYFIGSDPKKWFTGIPNFGRVFQRDIYEGIDVTYHGSQGQLDYEFKVAPHAQPEAITIAILGADHFHRNSQGDLLFSVANAQMRLQRPFAYQDVNGVAQPVASQYIIRKNSLSFKVGKYDPSRPLIIRPVLSYSGYLKLQDARSAVTGSWLPHSCQGVTSRFQFQRSPFSTEQLSEAHSYRRSARSTSWKAHARRAQTITGF
jgi:hypothetical protein